MRVVEVESISVRLCMACDGNHDGIEIYDVINARWPVPKEIMARGARLVGFFCPVTRKIVAYFEDTQAEDGMLSI